MSTQVFINLLFEITSELQKTYLGRIWCSIIISPLNDCSNLLTGLRAPFPFNSYGSFGAGGTLCSSQNAQPTPNNRTFATLWREAVYPPEIKGVKDLLGVTFGDSVLENESNTEEMVIFKT